MSRVTLSAVLTLLRLVLSFANKAARLLYSIIDLVDDGCLNASVEKPAWYQHVIGALTTLESVCAHLSNIEDSITVNSPNE